MSDTSLIIFAALVFWIRLAKVLKLWRAPLRNGEEWFLAQRIGPGFYREAGATLLRRYRSTVCIPVVLDAPLALWLGITGRYVGLVVEQFVAMILTAILYNLMAVHFSYRAAAIVGPGEERTATAVQLSMAPRRLRDHTHRWVELVIGAAVLLSIMLLVRAYVRSTTGAGRDAHELFGLLNGALFLLYLQLGFLLLKVVFVRWRKPLPAKRTEDFLRWRAAWLSYHLRCFDGARLLLAVLLLFGTFWGTSMNPWRPRATLTLAVVTWLVVLAWTVFCVRERRRLAAVEREVKPVELAKEFPRSPVPEGRFLAGGMLYFNRENPGAIVRSTQGIALNLAHPSTYSWAAYLIGFVLLMTWLARSA